MRMRNGKVNVFVILLGVFLVSFIGFCIFASQQGKILEIDTEALAHIETINSGVQRVSKLELENSSDDPLIALLDTTATELSPADKSSKYFSENMEMSALASDIANDWTTFRKAVSLYRETGDRDVLFLASENNYNNSTNAIKKVNSYIDELSGFVDLLEIVLIAHIVILLALLAKTLYSTIIELKKSKELSKDMFIDTSTGLYNRSKCQEVLKSSVTPNNNKERAVVIFDLNDLKKTNDSLGHRAGDQLISTFAAQLKEATKIFPYETFVGRYGGDEFMAYFSSVNRKDVELYINEVDFLMKKYNENGSRLFNISCASGYSITTKQTKSLTVRELFDEADEDMYKNKIAMKERKKQKMIAQGIEIVEVVDDRLQ